MNTERESCGTCKYFSISFANGMAKGHAVMGECVNSESDYEHRIVDAAFSCEMFESRLES